MVEDVLVVPLLREVEAIASAFDVNADEEVEVAHVLDCELSTEVFDDGVEQSQA